LAKVTVTTVVGDTVTASSTGALKILDLDTVGQIGSDWRAETTAGTDYNSAAGTQTYSKVATTTSVVFYVFTTSTTAASLTINKGGNTRIVWIKGAEGPAYNIDAALPATIPTSAPSANNVIVKITDIFGNTVKAAATVTSSTTGAGQVLDPVAGSMALTYSSTEGGHGFKMHTTSTGGLALSLAISATDVTGLAKAKKSLFLTSTAVDVAALQTSITALTAQVAALTADYNALATKFNKKVKKKNRVTLK
jgi:hypothetical protein